MYEVPKKGDTLFAPLNELYHYLSNSNSPQETEQKEEEMESKWDRLWMVSATRSGPVHPLVYYHPVSKKKTMCFHLGGPFLENLCWDYDQPDKRRTLDPLECQQIISELNSALQQKQNFYRHHWQEGELMITDNLAVCHLASEETQYPVEEVGLRVLHRTTIAGKYRPSHYKYPPQSN